MARRSASSGQVSQFISAHLDEKQAKDLKRAIRDAGKVARRSMRLRLKEAGAVIQKEIKGRTPVGGGGGRRAVGQVRRGVTRTASHPPGLLRRSTKLRIGSLRVTVYNDAKSVSRAYPGGYRYGKRLEFDPKMGARLAFFYPGFDASKGEAIAMFEKVLVDAQREYMRG